MPEMISRQKMKEILDPKKNSQRDEARKNKFVRDMQNHKVDIERDRPRRRT